VQGVGGCQGLIHPCPLIWARRHLHTRAVVIPTLSILDLSPPRLNNHFRSSPCLLTLRGSKIAITLLVFPSPSPDWLKPFQAVLKCLDRFAMLDDLFC
jgi:hypothetical protein